MTKLPYGYQDMPPASASKYKKPKEPEPIAVEDDLTPEEEAPRKVIAKRGRKKGLPKPKNRSRAQYVEDAKADGRELLRERVRRVFADGPKTVAQVRVKEGLTAHSNTRTLVARWAAAGLIEIVGTVGTHPGVQNVWDMKKELKK